jgi:hypothetical protein
MSEPKSKKLVIYEDREKGSLFLRATRTTSDPTGFAIKDSSQGMALPRSVSNEELGKSVREILRNCD